MIKKEIITEWFELRFGKDHSKTDGYFDEWMDRFKSGVDFAVTRMDAESLRMFEDMMIKYGISIFDCLSYEPYWRVSQ